MGMKWWYELEMRRGYILVSKCRSGLGEFVCFVYFAVASILDELYQLY